MREELMDVNGHTVAALIFNENLAGPPIVFLHGMTASNHLWEPTLPKEVRDRRRWIALSLPGHAPAKFPSGFRHEDVTPAMFSDVLGDAICRLTSAEPAVLVGWSTGGFAALNLAARRPELVRSVVSLCGFLIGRCTGDIDLLQRLSLRSVWGRPAFVTLFRLLGLSRRVFDRSLTRGCGPGRTWNVDSYARRTGDLLRDSWRGLDPHAICQLFRGISRFDLTEEFGKIRQPVLIMGGTHDPYIPVAHTKLLAETIPGAQLWLIDGGGHMFFGEWRDAYHNAVTDWIASH